MIHMISLTSSYRSIKLVTALLAPLIAVCLALQPARCGAQDEFQLYRELAPVPYRPAIRFVWEADDWLTAGVRADVERDVRGRIRDATGRYWSPEYSSTIVADATDLEARRESLTRELKAGSNDKVIVVSVRRDGLAVKVAACEWDATTQNWSAVARRETVREDFVSAAVVQCVRSAFRPLFRIIDTDGDAVRMIARAGELFPPDPEFAPIEPGSISQPTIVYYDRKQVRQKTQQLPLTYVYVESRDRAYVQGTTVSAFRGALGGSRRNRVELWSLGGRATTPDTRLKLVRQDDPTRVLMGQRVVVSPRVFLKEEPRAAQTELLSDRDGFVSILPHPASPIVWLYVWSGEALLARVPYAPGWERESTLSLPDDSIRLEVEGKLDRLKGDLTETVARRAVLKAQALAAAKKGDKEAAGNLKAALRKMPTAADLTAKLELIRAPAIVRAKAARQRVVAIRINKSCDSLGRIIKSYLDPDRMREAMEEIDSLIEVAP